MNKIITYLVLTLSTMGFLKSQAINDSVSNGVGYTTQSFYSLQNGEVANIPNKNWDIAFSLSGQGKAGSAILLNELNAILWAVPQDTSFWAGFDTANYTTWKRLFNSDTTWVNGAYNKHRGLGPNGTFDMGWGYLDPSNNFWTLGDSLYLCKLNNGTFKKIWVESLKQGIWKFRYANIDGTNDTTITINKANYTNKNFIYYSLENDTLLDREPDNTTWELTFTGHKDEIIPGMVLPLVSVFSNRKVWTAKANSSSYSDAVLKTQPQTPYTQKIDNIGREWKRFSSGSWYIRDTVSYFVYDNDSTDFYRIVFTDFGGSATGKSYFNIEKIGTASINTTSNKITMAVYPNPCYNKMSLLLNLKKSENLNIKLINIKGQVVKEIQERIFSNTQIVEINTSQLKQGVYFVTVKGDSFSTSTKIIKK